jgi:hypothetical protein
MYDNKLSCAVTDAVLCFSTDASSVRIRVDVDVTEPPQGHLWIGREVAMPFSGWIELLGLLEQALTTEPRHPLGGHASSRRGGGAAVDASSRE